MSRLPAWLPSKILALLCVLAGHSGIPACVGAAEAARRNRGTVANNPLLLKSLGETSAKAELHSMSAFLAPVLL